MQYLFATFLCLAAATACAHEQDVQRALVQRDQMTMEFSAQLRGVPIVELQALHAQQLRDAQRPLAGDPALASQLLPYQRTRMEEDRLLLFAPPLVRKPVSGVDSNLPLPLPGRPAGGVDPVTPDGVGR